MTLINLLLLGRTGNGKSSTGNSILGRREFTPRSFSSSISYVIQSGRTTLEDKTITVVDGPGVGDTTTDITEDGQSMISLIQKALSLISNKLHVLILVLKYGVRFTNQERDAVKMIKAILGDDVLRNYGIILITHGDSFDLDGEDEPVGFETWCARQTGDIQILFNECGKRYVMFNNKSDIPSVLKKQNEQLMKMVTDITMNRQPYNEDDFNKAEYGRKKLFVMGKLPELQSSTEKIMGGFTKQLERIVKENSPDHAKNILELSVISDKLEKHVQFLEDEDQNTGSIVNLLVTIKIIKNRVKTMIDLQTVKLKLGDNERAQSDSETLTSLPRITQPNSQRRWIRRVGSTLCRYLESLRLALGINIERIRSAPLSCYNLFVYLMCVSTLCSIVYKIYRKLSCWRHRRIH